MLRFLLLLNAGFAALSTMQFAAVDRWDAYDLPGRFVCRWTMVATYPGDGWAAVRSCEFVADGPKAAAVPVPSP